MSITEPISMQRPGVKSFNMSQLIPRRSKEIENNLELYQHLGESMAPVYRWVREMVSTINISSLDHYPSHHCQLEDHLPEESTILSRYTDSLPCEDRPLCEPFAGMVYNLNVATGIHRDWGDDSICFIVVVTDCPAQDGCLVLKEPGLVVELLNGDGFAFKSAEITHLNFDFNGLRASMVFHSDKQARIWVVGKNGWSLNKYFRNLNF